MLVLRTCLPSSISDEIEILRFEFVVPQNGRQLLLLQKRLYHGQRNRAVCRSDECDLLHFRLVRKEKDLYRLFGRHSFVPYWGAFNPANFICLVAITHINSLSPILIEMLTTCSWTPTNAPIKFDKELFIYDGGGYIGFLLGSDWKCWRVLRRERVGEDVVETVEEMPEDWVPPNVVSSEVYKCAGSFESGLLQITGWTITLGKMAV